MSGETWAAASSDAETWVSIADSGNGYVAALFVRPVFVSQQTGNAWSEESDAASSWAAA